MLISVGKGEVEPRFPSLLRVRKYAKAEVPVIAAAVEEQAATTAEIDRSLTEAVSAKGKAKAKEASRAFVIADGKKGVIRAGKGGAVTVELPRGVLPPARWAAFETALQKLLSDLPEAP